MPRVSEYTVIFDAPFEIKTGGDNDFEIDFSLPKDASLSSRSVLAFVMDTEANASNLRFQVRINGKDVRTARVSGDTFQTLHEVVNGFVLVAGPNKIEFRILSGTGDLHISDVVLWWKRNT